MKLVINGQEMEFAEGASALDVLDKLPKDVKKERAGGAAQRQAHLADGAAAGRRRGGICHL